MAGSLWIGLVAVFSIQAHDSPEHVVELLTARMKSTGPRPELLWRRATEYRALSKWAEAEKDLRAAVRLRKDFLAAWVDLSRVELARNNPRSAAKAVQQALKLGQTPEWKAGLLMLQAEILAARGRLPEAVSNCDQALAAEGAGNPEWYLTRYQFQYRLGWLDAAAAGLHQGVERTGNAVLEAEWIDAAIDAGQFDKVSDTIDARIAESRCQASWLIRRGRVQEGLGRISRAQSDYLAALAELNGRLGGRREDFSLLIERGLVYALLGDVTLARTDLERARELGADAWTLNRLERATSLARASNPSVENGKPLASVKGR
jgi:tetratricopeptide (TPR) repeat protein